MSDFFQGGPFATLHRLGAGDAARIERELAGFAKARPVALVLPCHAEELGSPALAGIIRELSGAGFLGEIVVGIDGADEADWRRAQKIFRSLPQKPVLLWNDGPEVMGLLGRLGDAGLSPGPAGKGRNLWLCSGYALASGRSRVVAAHDCDITTFTREMLVRLCYPVAHPDWGFTFCKGYSARFSDRLNGRIMRLLFTPLVRSLRTLFGPQEFLTFLDAFRYPLSGEICLDVEVLRHCSMPGDWGVEVGLLGETMRLCEPRAICQTDVAERYDHKHRELSPDDPRKGLNKMACDVARQIFRTLATGGVHFETGFLDSLLSEYARRAAEAVRFSAADAALNGLAFIRADEELAVSTFTGAIRAAASVLGRNPAGGHPVAPAWAEVQSTLPDFLPALLEAGRRGNSQG